MSNPKTHVAIILDKSGSMNSTKDAAISGYNEQIQQLKLNAKDGQEILVSLVTFNGEVYEHLWEQPVEKLDLSSSESYQPNGATSMRDAVGYTVQKLLKTTDQNEENAAWLIITISDGETNSDRHFNPAQLKEIIQGCQDTKKWTFTYLGCSEAYLEELSRQTGVSTSNMAAWNNTTMEGADVGAKYSALRSAGYFDSRKMGMTSVDTYMNDKADQVADLSDVETAKVMFTAAAAAVNTNIKIAATADDLLQGKANTFGSATSADWKTYSPK